MVCRYAAWYQVCRIIAGLGCEVELFVGLNRLCEE